MIPVDLNRLREAMNDWDMDQAISVHPVFAVGVAVLAAPTVWWCEVIRDVEIDPSECDNCDPAIGCGWVALVPVKGEAA